MDFDPEKYKHWTPAAQEKAIEELRQRSTNQWRPFYCPRLQCDGKPHGQWKWPHARADQRPPLGDWLTWLMRGGRGSGKTRTGSEWTNKIHKVAPRIALVAPTGPDARDIMVEGESGILAKSKPGERPLWEPSKRRLTWPNGALGFTYSGEEPDRLRGPQHHAAWVEEGAHIALIEEVWSNLMFGLRLYTPTWSPKVLVTTTPLPSRWIKELVADEQTVSVVASTYRNIENLSPLFAQQILKRYEGTRKGKQEIYGEILADVEGALWTWEIIEDHRITQDELPDELDRVVVAIDPAGSSGKKSDETGITVEAVKGDQFYTLDDGSGKYSPKGWADRAVGLLERYSADCLVVERNYGGDMVRTTLENSDQKVRIKEVTSRRGKVIRADPIVALYERGLVHHVGERLGELEDQLLSWVPGSDSPDRLDAHVHGITELAKVVAPSAIADPRSLRNLPPRHLRSVS